MGKKIGIKLADGSFYPIMEDGVPQKKLMELTTVQDNQTTASIDLYRSESGTMEDAEYVDTLEISELVPHPGGETSMSFTLQLDENNMLSAEIADPESGKTSTTKADLVNLPSDQRKNSTDYNLSEVEDIEFEEPPLPEAPVNGAAEEDDFSEEEPEEDFTVEDTDSLEVTDFVAPEVGDIDLDLDDFASIDDQSHVAALLGEDDTVVAPAVSDTITGGEFDSFDLPDFDEPIQEAAVQEETVSKSSFDLPDFGFENEASGFVATDTDTDTDAPIYEDSLPDFSRFEIPDFDEPLKNDFSFSEESGLFTESDFKDPAFYMNEPAPAANPFDFSDLYDDRESEIKQQETRKRRSAISVAICLICALVCVGILLFILFILPDKISDGTVSLDGQVASTTSHTLTVTEEELESEPDRTAAVEDVIVIVETPAVVPAPPPQAVEAPEVVRYKVKWGDTLWDIAQSYYDNPWLYKLIASVNNIKNPDYVVAGTILTIPPQ